MAKSDLTSTNIRLDVEGRIEFDKSKVANKLNNLFTSVSKTSSE